MRDSDLINRPAKGWTPWKPSGVAEIGRVWWQAKELHFPKLNITVWFDGSALVGIEHWGCRRPQWTMRKPPADWQAMPKGYREAADAAWRAWRAEQDRRGHTVPAEPVQAPLPLQQAA